MFAGIGFSLGSFLSLCVCVRGRAHKRQRQEMVVCMQVQGMLSCPPTHPTHPTTQPIQPVLGGCMQVQVCYHPPTQPIQPIQIISVRSYVCKSKVRYHHPPHHPPTHPTHPTYPNQIRTVVCVQVQGTLSSPPPHPPTPQPIQPIQIESVWSYVCKSKVCHHHPPTHPTYPNRIRMVVCMQVQGMLSSPPPLNEAQVREKPRRKWYMRGASESEAQVRKNARRKWESCHMYYLVNMQHFHRTPWFRSWGSTWGLPKCWEILILPLRTVTA